MENQMFHVCTKGFSDRLLFRDRKDFIQGINRAALAFNGNCRIAAMCLMSNHVHFIAIGDEDKVEMSIVKFKKTYSMWMASRYGVTKVFRRWPHSIIRCAGNDYMKSVISYVYRNPVGHSETNNPYYYPWSSINVHFTEEGHISPYYFSYKGQTVDVNLLHPWEKRAILHTKDEIPEAWIINSEGMLTFSSFIDTSIVESIFRTERSFNYFIQRRERDSSGRSVVRLDMEEENLCCDISALKMAGRISALKYGVGNVLELEESQKRELMEELIVKYGTDEAIVRRILGLLPD